MKTFVLLMSMVLIGLSSAAPFGRPETREAMLQKAISKLIEKALQQDEQMEQAEVQYPWIEYPFWEEAEEQKETEQAEKKIALMKLIEQLREAKQHAMTFKK